MIKAIIFDFFDVIRTDSYHAWLKRNSIKNTEEYDKASHRQDIGETTLDQFLERLSELQGRPVTIEEIDVDTKIDHDVLQLAEALRKDYKIGLLSNAPSAFLRNLLFTHDLTRYFDEIIISSEVGMVKPSPEIFHLMLAKLGVEPSEAIFTDDNADYVHAAAKIGIHGIQFTSAAQLKKALAATGVAVS